MRSHKHGLKALVLAIMAVLGTMAFGAAGAQGQSHNEKLHSLSLHDASLNSEPLLGTAANTLGSFLINLGLIALPVSFTMRQIGTSTLLVPGRNYELVCLELEFSEGKITSSTHGQGAATFTGCKAFEHKTLAALPCKIPGETTTASILILPILHGPVSNRENFLLFEPANLVTNLKIFKFEEGTECPLPLSNPVTGAFSGLVDALDMTKQLLLLDSGVQLLTGDVLRVGGFPAYLRAHLEIEGLAPHNQKLGIH